MRLKKIKGADIVVNSCKYTINNPEEYKGKYKKLFNNNNPIHIEIGSGKGDFIINMAKKAKKQKKSRYPQNPFSSNLRDMKF